MGLAFLGCATEKEFVAGDPKWSQQLDLDEGGSWRDSERLFGEGSDPSKLAMRGVRLDLALRPEANPDARCRCLDVAVGEPDDPRFQWAGEIPRVSSDQLVVALRPTEGPGCPPLGYKVDQKRLSIRAVDIWEPHVIVVVEELGYERPLAVGAVIRRPQVKGSVLLRPREREQPFAKSQSATQGGAAELQGMCRAYVRQPGDAPAAKGPMRTGE